MKPTQYPEEDSRTAPLETRPVEPADTRPRGENLRYVEIPANPDEAKAQRNLACGIVCTLLAAVAVWIGLKLDRGTALLCLFSSLGAFGIAWLFANMRVLRQRFGQFFGLAIAALLGAVMPFVGAGLSSLDKMADQKIAGRDGRSDETGPRTVPPPVPTAANAPAAPTAPELSPDDLQATPAVVPPPVAAKGVAENAKAAPARPKLPPDDGIVRDFIAPAPDMKSGKIITIQEDCVVEIEGRKWRLKAGQMYKFKNLEDGVVTFFAGDQEVAIASDFVKFTGNSLEDRARIQQLAWAEAVARYPALRDENSKERRMFDKKKFDINDEPDGKVFFEDPRWPVMLADRLAAENQWGTGTEPAATEGAATDSPEAPAPSAPAAPGNGPAPAGANPRPAPEQKSPEAPAPAPAPPAAVVPAVVPPVLPALPKSPE